MGYPGDEEQMKRWRISASRNCYITYSIPGGFVLKLKTGHFVMQDLCSNGARRCIASD